MQMLGISPLRNSSERLLAGLIAHGSGTLCHQARPRKTTDSIVTRWLIVRYLVVGAYVGLATAAGFVWWYLLAPVRTAACGCGQLRKSTGHKGHDVATCCAQLQFAALGC